MAGEPSFPGLGSRAHYVLKFQLGCRSREDAEVLYQRNQLHPKRVRAHNYGVVTYEEIVRWLGHEPPPSRPKNRKHVQDILLRMMLHVGGLRGHLPEDPVLDALLAEAHAACLAAGLELPPQGG